LYEQIVRAAVSWSVAAAGCEEIDRINIHRRRCAMQRAVMALVPCPDFAG
jgi:ribonuclease HII